MSVKVKNKKKERKKEKVTNKEKEILTRSGFYTKIQQKTMPAHNYSLCSLTRGNGNAYIQTHSQIRFTSSPC